MNVATLKRLTGASAVFNDYGAALPDDAWLPAINLTPSACRTSTGADGENYTVTADNRLFYGDVEVHLDEPEAEVARKLCSQEDLSGLNRFFNAVVTLRQLEAQHEHALLDIGQGGWLVAPPEPVTALREPRAYEFTAYVRGAKPLLVTAEGLDVFDAGYVARKKLATALNISQSAVALSLTVNKVR